MLQDQEKAVLFAIARDQDNVPIEESLAELSELARSAGLTVVGNMVQRRGYPEPGTYLGEGKVEELAQLMASTEANIAICDDELSPAQAAHLMDRLDGRVIDRTQLILDIFAARAASREGKVQVELAQLRYLLPRLTGYGTELSRLGAGIGTRGPGETKLETDRRHIRHRMAELRRELNRIRQRRKLQREARREARNALIALVGYTNAGKSTLLNRLSGSAVLAEDRLFATLDPTIRGVELPQGETALFVDTVGFIRKLPHELIAAFRATLEEVVEADVLVHVVDISHPRFSEQMAAVEEVLCELGAAQKPTVTAFNKSDLVAVETVAGLLARTPQSCLVSALTGAGCERLLELVGDVVPERHVVRTYIVPYTDGKTVAWLHEQGRVLAEEYGPEGTILQVELRQHLANKVMAYSVVPPIRNV